MTTKPDSEIIQEAYEAAVGKVFAVFVDNLAEGLVSQADAETKFSNGIQLAKKARDLALKHI